MVSIYYTDIIYNHLVARDQYKVMVSTMVSNHVQYMLISRLEPIMCT